MSSVDIEIVSVPNLRKIESFLNDSSYRETIEISSNFNARLCMERKSRMPFVDAQTGVAQRSCHLYAHRRQRMPALREGQIYSYPSQRWRKPKRQYLMRMQNARPFRSFKRVDGPEGFPSDSLFTEKVSGGNPMQIEDSLSSSYSGLMNEGDMSKDGGTSKNSEDLPKDWLYDEIDMNDIDGMDDADNADSDFEYNVNGYKRKTSNNRRRTTNSRAGSSRRSRADASGSGESTPRRSRNPAGASANSRRRRKPAEKLPKEPDLEADTYTPAFEPTSFDSAENNFELRNYRKNVWSDHC
ncbi:zinc finger protein ubi-d4 [Culicoides brevitarsis]|uniref:zinc finger protein ubi-d4 n=1 Tax=Culicoides brevitarsis TaxID=469753 RepID=UPI00307B11D0